MSDPSTARSVAKSDDEALAGASRPAEQDMSVPVIEKLRERVVRAVEELARLRAANIVLQERVRELTEGQGAQGAVSAAALFEDDADVVKERVVRFIEAIDRYMEEVEDSGPESD